MPTTSLSRFVIQPLPVDVVARFRGAPGDDFGRACAPVIADGGEPMRDQLRRASPGERLLLGGYQAVPRSSPYAEVGPIFVSAEAPAAAPVVDALPIGYFNRTFALRAYDAADRILDSTLVDPADAPERFREWLARPGVAYLHARFAGHGCFAAQIIRA